MSYSVKVFFKGQKVDSPLSIDNIFKIEVNGKEVQPKDVSIDGAKSILIHCTNNAVSTINPSELLALTFKED